MFIKPQHIIHVYININTIDARYRKRIHMYTYINMNAYKVNVDVCTCIEKVTACVNKA